MKNFRKIPISMFLVAISLTASPIQAATYYIDYASGSDTNSGLSTSAPWKHTPGDSNATGGSLAKEKTLQPGDTLIFKGGVTYYGKFYNFNSGTTGKPITYDGNTAGTWGTGRAILNGGVVFAPVGANWSATTQNELRGNPNYSHIYSIAVPDTTTYLSSIFEDGEFLWVSQNPNPGTTPNYDFFNYDKVEYFQTIPRGSTDIIQTSTTLKDTVNFSSTDANFYTGSYILTWVDPNVTTVKAITAYNPGTKTITYNNIGVPYTSRNSGYAIYNHPIAIDTPGEYYLDETNHRLYVWPRNSDNPNQHTYAIGGGNAILGRGSYVTIQGFKMIEYQSGIGFPYNENKIYNVTIKDNELENFRSNGSAMIGVNGDNILIENNSVSDGQRAIGIISGGIGNNNQIIRGNTVNNTSRQGIWFMDNTNGVIDNNLVTNINGTHSNAISVYSSTADDATANIKIINNRVYDSDRSLTFSGTTNLLIYNNIFHGAASSWAGMSGYLRLFNNVFTHSINLCLEGGPNGCGTNGVFTDITVKNNILHGINGKNWANFVTADQITHENNLYTAINGDQKASYNWTFGNGEIVDTTGGQTAAFNNPSNHDFTLKSGSLAINNGVNLSSYFTTDIIGNSRPAVGVWDIGAYESDSSNPPVQSDTTAPIITTFTIPSTSTTLNVPISTFAAYDLVGVTSYRISESATTPTVATAGWTSSAPTTYTFSTTGTKTLYAWTKDAAGNISAVSSDSVIITLPNSGIATTTPATTTPVVVDNSNKSSSHRSGGGGSSSNKNKTAANSLTTTNISAPTISYLPTLTGPFAIGMTGNEQVKVLQQYLSQDSTVYPSKIIDGNYSNAVTEAVIKFQAKYGINTTGGTGGLAGPVTRAKLNEVYGLSASTKTNLITQIKQQLLQLQIQLLRLLIAQKTSN